jgi:hypothetical protein
VVLGSGEPIAIAFGSPLVILGRGKLLCRLNSWCHRTVFPLVAPEASSFHAVLVFESIGGLAWFDAQRGTLPNARLLLLLSHSRAVDSRWR